MTRKRLLTACSLALLALNAAPLLAQTDSLATSIRNGKRPQLVVVISIDQFRGDYLYRWANRFKPAIDKDKKLGGFRYLMESGSYFVNAHHTHYPTYTGPGHAAIMTGATPNIHGIISNSWWNATPNEAKSGLEAPYRVYCVEDYSTRIVSSEPSKATPVSPRNLISTTVGDELKLATNSKSKLISLAMKDRAAILLAGHKPDMCLWCEEKSPRWISSSYYCPTGSLPTWTAEINRAQKGRTPSEWDFSSEDAPAEKFHHKVGAETTKLGAPGEQIRFSVTPYANRFVFYTAKQAIEEYKLGRNPDAPDMLTMNLSTNDYVGHAFGPYSLEAREITVETDKALSGFLNFLNRYVPGGLSACVVVITGDHGVAPIPEQLRDMGISAGRIKAKALVDTVEKALNAQFGERKWLSERGAYEEPCLYLNPDALNGALSDRTALSKTEIIDVAAQSLRDMEGIYAAYTSSQIQENLLPQSDLAKRISSGFHPKRSGDVLIIPEQNYISPPFSKAEDQNSGTSHGTPFAYDTHVPILISGFGIRSGVRAERVSTLDIAPTLSLLLGIEFPSGCVGTPLTSAFK